MAEAKPGAEKTAHFTPAEPGPRRDWVLDDLDDLGLDYKDKRPSGGCLWVIGGEGLRSRLEATIKRRADFKLSERGGKVTGGRAAWWLKGYPEEREEKPASELVIQAELDRLKPGDTVFHKAFGYGEVVDLDEGYVEVAFENDDHRKKPSRKFVFPGAFYQRLLRMV